MSHKSHRVSSRDFNRLIEVHQPNIVAYAMMLYAGDQERDAVILKAMEAIWERRKEYRPSEWPDFCHWSYAQIADQVVAQDSCDEVAHFARHVREPAASFLPATAHRMRAFDKAFFALSGKEKEILSTSCQHHRLQDNYMSKHKLSRDRFNSKVESLKLALLVSTAWDGGRKVGPEITPAVNSALLRFVAKPAGAGELVDKMRELFLENDGMLRQYFSHVALQQALMVRLVDGPGSQLRDEEKVKSRKIPLVYFFAPLILIFLLLFAVKADGEGMKNEVKNLAYLVIPEPSSVSMLALGLGGLLMRRSRDDGHKMR